MLYSEIKRAIMSNVEQKDHTSLYIVGAPGTGKTSAPLDVAEMYGIPSDVAKRCIFRPSLRDPVDLLGVPDVVDTDKGRMTVWTINAFISYLNDVAEKYGVCIFIVDELAQAPVMMQNALAGLMYDRFVGENYLDDRVYVVATGNRVKDKAGAGRIMSQLGNRVEVLEMDSDLRSWCTFMIMKGYDPMIAAFIQYSPDALHDFDPDRISNATMRSWESVAKVDSSLSPNIYRAKVCGRVGEGQGSTYLAFRSVASSLPDIKSILADPHNALLPEEQAARWAAVGLLFKHIGDANWPALCTYIARFSTELHSPDMEVAFFQTVRGGYPSFVNTKQYSAWAIGRGAEVLL